jgi:hypothetical protein
MAARNAGLDLLHGGKTSMTAKTRVRILYGAVTCGALIGSIVAYFNNFNTGRLGFAALGGAVAIVAANTMVALTHRRAPLAAASGASDPLAAASATSHSFHWTKKVGVALLAMGISLCLLAIVQRAPGGGPNVIDLISGGISLTQGIFLLLRRAE